MALQPGRSDTIQNPGSGRGFAIDLDDKALGAIDAIGLCPDGLLTGAEASAAVAAGTARPLAGGPTAFSRGELFLDGPGGLVSATGALAEIEGWLAAEGAGQALAPRFGALMTHLTAPRPDWAGLAMDRPHLMGIVNATPDSFSDGGRFADPSAAVAQAEALIAAGADIVDVGGESTRPGSQPVPENDQIARVVPVIRALRGCGAEISIDARRARVMRAALDAGATIINDVAALEGDPDSLSVAADSEAAIVLMHMKGEPATMNIAPTYGHAPWEVYRYLERRVAACEAAGIDRARLAIDPGIGFGKTQPQSQLLIDRIALLHGLGCPILLGASRKLGPRPGPEAPRNRLGGPLDASIDAVLRGQARGAQLFRVHDVAETRAALVESGAL